MEQKDELSQHLQRNGLAWAFDTVSHYLAIGNFIGAGTRRDAGESDPPRRQPYQPLHEKWKIQKRLQANKASLAFWI